MTHRKKTSWIELSNFSLALPLMALLLISGNAWSEKSTLRQKPSTEVDTDSEQIKIIDAEVTITEENEQPMVGVEQMPEYPGGEAELEKYLSENVQQQSSAVESFYYSRVIIRFVISKTGQVINPEIMRGINPYCDQEAIRVISSMPKWIPGRQNGRDVPIYFTLPINFKMENPEAEYPEAEKKRLVIIDGVEHRLTPHDAMSRFKPKDVESVEVLEDSSAVATYGEKGRNGVIIIKKKK